MAATIHTIIAGMNVTPPLSLHQLEDKFPFKVILDLIALPLPKTAFNKKSRKWHADKILSYLDKNVKHGGQQSTYRHVLGVTDIELYFEKPSHLFGLSEVGKNSVISLTYLKPKSLNSSSDEKIFGERALKIAMHEAGHAFGLGHCRTSGCVMSFTRKMDYLDNQLDEYCNPCKKKLLARASKAKLKSSR